MPNRRGTWLNKHLQDPYYKKAKQEGFRARSAFKLLQINQKYPVFKVKGRFPKKILDLGCAPGAWIEAAIAEYEKTPPSHRPPKIKLLGIDLTSIKEFPEYDGIQFYRGDVFKENTEKVVQELAPYSLIISDLAPKTSGDFRDIAIQESMVEKVLELVGKYLIIGGNILIKMFQSEETQKFVKKWMKSFRLLKLMKPQASRTTSKEIFLIGLEFNGIA